MKYALFFLAFLMISGCSSIPKPTPIEPQALPPGDLLYFPETGHSVTEPFLSFYRKANHSALLGYPITEATFVDEWRVQYFQFGQLELHPENTPTYFVTVGWTGLLSHNNVPPKNRLPVNISGDFAAFYASNGDSVQFGKALAPPFIDKGQLVQDFQSARLIWSPSPGQSPAVKPAPLSESYLLKNNLDALIDAVPPSPAATIVTVNQTPVPKDAVIDLTIEPTENDAFSRVIVRMSKNNEPLTGYATSLRWEQQSINLPPTNYAGEAHLLLRHTFSPETPLNLFDSETLIFHQE